MAQEVSTSPTCQVVILTALPVEFRAVVAYLQETQEIIHPQGTIYRVGSFVGSSGPLRVAVAQIGMGGGSAAVETERAIHFFRPSLSLFVGIAGGLKDVQLGDVVAATKVYACESGKAGRTFEPRPEVWRASYPLEQRVRQEVSAEAWQARLQGALPDSVPHAHIGALAAGEKVLASTQSAVYAHIKATYGDALAAEMEGHGFLQAIHVNHNMHGLVIRGISDLIDNKAVADAGGSQIRAAHHAAAFAFQVLATFTFPPSTLSSSSLAHYSVWTVPYLRNPYFTGRDELLDRLDQQLSSELWEHGEAPRRAALTQPKAIKGLGGIGKTQIAVEYAYRSRDRYTHTFWINAASEEAVVTSFVALAELLPAFPMKDERDQQKLVEAIKRWLEQCQQRWLLIFDNADDVALVRNYLPQQGNGSILLTTRADAVSGALATPVEVETMGFIEGTQLLLRRAQRFEQASDEEINQAGNIVIALDHFPLALDQAGAYIEETKCSFSDYLQLYQTHRRALLARRGTLTTDYPHSIATTWSLSFQKVEQANPMATELLHIFALLAPDRIPEELIKDSANQWPPLLQQAAVNPFTFNQMLEELLKFSLVKRLAEDHMLSIHRLVQAVQMENMEPEVQRTWAERVVLAVNEAFPHDPFDITMWPKCLRYLEQVEACNRLIQQHEFAFPEAAYVLDRAGIYLHKHALYAIAEPLFQRALHICEQQLGTEHPLVATSLNNLVALYNAQGKYAEAEPLSLRALHIEEQLGGESRSMASSLNNLAIIYKQQGKYTETEPLLLRVLHIREQQLGTEHPDTAASLDNLAVLYSALGKYAEAELLSLRALHIHEQQLGAEHLDTAASLDNLANLYREQGKYAEAEPLYLRALHIREQHEHPNTVYSLKALADLYREQGKYAEAETLYLRVLHAHEQQLGAEHPDTAAILNNLAILYDEQGRYSEAETLYLRALRIGEQQLGAEHPLVAQYLSNLGAFYREQRKYVKAKSLSLRALHIREQVLGTEHPLVATSLNNLALLSSDRGKYSEAEPLYLRALHIREQMLGTEHPLVAQSLNNLATLYREQGRYSEADPLFQRALRIREQQLGAKHPLTQRVRKNYASLKRAMKRRDWKRGFRLFSQ